MLDRKQSHSIFASLERQLDKLAKKPASKNIHKFRTYGRRVETILSELGPDGRPLQKKLLKQLKRLRKKAGRVRDLDVQVATLRSLKIPQEPAHKVQLFRVLAEERDKDEKKIVDAFDKNTVRSLRRRLKHASREVDTGGAKDPLIMALAELAQLGRDHLALTEKTLHQYRVAGKRARYLAEVAGKSSAADQMIKQLKHMQDVIGDWHDWLKLTERAEELFGSSQESALVAALRNITRAKFRQAAEALTEMRAQLAEGKAGRKGPTRQLAKAEAAVA